MPAPLSEDLRQRIVKAYQAGGLTYAEVAENFSVGTATVNRLLNRFRRTGSVEPSGHGGGHPRSIRNEGERVLSALIRKHPDWTEAELTKAFVKRTGQVVSRSTIGRAIRRLGYVVKKRPSAPANEIEWMYGDDKKNLPRGLRERRKNVLYFWMKPASTHR